MIYIKNVTKQYEDLVVLKDINLNIEEGSIFGIIGQSGAGKSTLLRCINGLEKFDRGDIVIDGNSISYASDRSIRKIRKEIGMVFQNFSLLSRLNVYDNISLPMKNWNYSKEVIENRTMELINLVGLNEKIKAFPSQLSGGQKQRVAIARALTLKPRILLCDEATSALDPSTTESILNLLKNINDNTGITILVVAHQLSIIRKICTHMAILENGNLANYGKTEDIFVKNPIALQRLQGFKENRANISVVINKENSDVFSKMARKLNIDFQIIALEDIGIKNPIRAHYLLKVPDRCINSCMNFLKFNNISCFRLGEW